MPCKLNDNGKWTTAGIWIGDVPNGGGDPATPALEPGTLLLLAAAGAVGVLYHRARRRN